DLRRAWPSKRSSTQQSPLARAPRWLPEQESGWWKTFVSSNPTSATLTRSGGTRDFRRKRLAIRPDCPIIEKLFLPDGNRLLQSIDQPAAGVQGGGAVGGCNHNIDAGFAN